jgi:hypothetical protein
MVIKCDEENRGLFCNVTNRATGSKAAARNDNEEASGATYVEIRGLTGARLK